MQLGFAEHDLEFRDEVRRFLDEELTEEFREASGRRNPFAKPSWCGLPRHAENFSCCCRCPATGRKLAAVCNTRHTYTIFRHRPLNALFRILQFLSTRMFSVHCQLLISLKRSTFFLPSQLS